MAMSFTTRNKRWVVPVIHILCWLVFFSIPFIERNEHMHFNEHLPNEHFAPPMHARDNMLYLSLVTNICIVAIFYINILFLSQIFTKQKRHIRYILIQLGSFILFYYLLKLFMSFMMPNDMGMPLGIQLFNYTIVILVGFCYSLIKENIEVEQKRKEKETENLLTELIFLRWQISPHFLFNVLNNMVSLARIKSEKLEKMLFDLSNLMRYMIYETEDHTISIEREIEYLKSYIDLQILRFSNEVTVNTNIFISENDNSVIEPMLLIPFIENAFKHGINNLISDPVITIDVYYARERLTMTIKNKCSPQLPSSNDETKGIGLANVKRRLGLLYPKRHSLNITVIDDWYSCTLGINLAENEVHNY